MKDKRLTPLQIDQRIKHLAGGFDHTTAGLKGALIKNHLDCFFIQVHTRYGQALAFKRLIKVSQAVGCTFLNIDLLSHADHEVFVVLLERLAVQFIERSSKA